MEPILKWAGGKRALLPKILELFPSNYKKRRYHEAFFGGGAVFFNVKPESGSVNDINSDLMIFYRVVRDRPLELIAEASQYSYDEKTYYHLRDKYNSSKTSDIEKAALFLYLNKTAYNGLYRVNSKGKFNVPFGRYKNPRIVPRNRILLASVVLRNVEILNRDFSYLLERSKEGDLCYFDPPYQPMSETADFTSYSSEGFGIEEQQRLRDLCLKLNQKKVLFVLSNSYTEAILGLYQNTGEFNVSIVRGRRAISSKAFTRCPVHEVLVTNIPR